MHYFDSKGWRVCGIRGELLTIAETARRLLQYLTDQAQSDIAAKK